MADTPKPAAEAPHLRRVLTLWDLIFYGIVLIQPIAPVPLFGVAQKLSDGHFATTILIAMGAMLITAFSYGRMASLYPAAGSAYTYVGRGLNPHLGFLAGWAMILDYILQPIINTAWISTTLQDRYRDYHIPQVHFVVWAVVIVGIITFLNLRGVKTSAVANKILLFFMFVVVAFFIYLAFRYIFSENGWAGVLSTQPFYNPATFHWPTVMTATSFAALTYIGFDGVTTLSEEVENPKRNVLLATVLTCIFAGVISVVEVYLGTRVWPDWRTFPNLESAFMDVCRRVGGLLLFHGMGAILIVAAFGSALTGGMGAARLLYGMGRDNVLPRKLFGHVSPRTGTPSYSILLIGGVSLAGVLGLNAIGNPYENAAYILNFGAFLAFMGVNFATFWQLTVTRGRDYAGRVVRNLIVLFLCLAPLYLLGALSGTSSNSWIVLILKGLLKPLLDHRTGLYAVGFLIAAWPLADIIYVSVKARGFGRSIPDAILPLFGFAFCGLIWWNLKPIAKEVGAVWFVLGLALLVIKTRGFREKPLMIDFKET